MKHWKTSLFSSLTGGTGGCSHPAHPGHCLSSSKNMLGEKLVEGTQQNFVSFCVSDGGCYFVQA